MDGRILDRLRACAAGAAIGDALGMPLEFCPPTPPDRLVTDMRPGRLPAGSFTDDTEMALALAESLLDHRPLDGNDLAQHFVNWYNTNPPDMGLHTASVLRQIAEGKPWIEATEEALRQAPANAGNGSVMRCWPVALVWWNNLPQLIADSDLQGRVTHPHPECVGGCIFINAMIFELVRGSNPAVALKQALQSTPMPEALRQVIQRAPQRKRSELQNSGWVRHTLESAVWGLMNSTSFEDALVEVVNLGNDADTAGAVVGALAGAAYGLEAIPTAWQSALQGEWPPHSGKALYIQDIINLADRLAGV